MFVWRDRISEEFRHRTVGAVYVRPPSLRLGKRRRSMSDRRSYVTPHSSYEVRQSMSDRRSYVTSLCLLDEPLLDTISYGTRKRRESMADRPPSLEWGKRRRTSGTAFFSYGTPHSYNPRGGERDRLCRMVCRVYKSDAPLSGTLSSWTRTIGLHCRDGGAPFEREKDVLRSLT